MQKKFSFVIAAQAGIHELFHNPAFNRRWIPACAAMTSLRYAANRAMVAD